MLANIKCLFSNTFKFQDIKNVLEGTCPDDSRFVTFLCMPFYPKITNKHNAIIVKKKNNNNKKKQQNKFL